MAHNDFTAATFRAPLAVYCGSVPKMKPGYRSLRHGSVDSTLQLRGSKWSGADTAALQSTLSLQMKKSYLWGRDGEEFHTEILPSALDAEVSNGAHPADRMNQREQEVDSAALETARLKDKLKRKLSEGYGSKGAPDSLSLVSNTLKPPVPRSASQRLLNATKPVPPIPRSPQRSPIPQSGGCAEGNTQENSPEITNGSEELRGQPVAPGEQEQNPLHSVRCSAERKRTALGGVLIPPIPKSAGITGEINPLESSLTSDSARITRESPVSRHRTSKESPVTSSAREKTSHKPLELETLFLESTPHEDRTDDCPTASTELSLESAPLNPVSFSFAKDEDVVQQAQPDKEEEGKETNGRINFTISKSAQDKMRQKLLEMENIRRDVRRSEQHFWERLQSIDTEVHTLEYPAAIASISLSGVATVPMMSNEKRRGVPSISLNKWVSRPSLPSISTLNQVTAANDARNASAYSLPANFQDCSEWDSESESGGSGIGPMSHPEQGMIEALKCLNHKDWEQKEKGLLSVRSLASCHPEVLYFRLHEVSTSVTREVSNLRSKVSRHAIKTLGDLFKALKKSMDPEVEEITRVLLNKIGDTNDFIREEADKSLEIMVENVSPSKTLSALIAGGVSHRNSSVRKCSAKYLLGVVEQLGGEKLLSGSRDNTDTLLRILVKLTQDGQQDTRFYGRRMFSLLMSHPKFEGQMERLIPSHDLRDLMATIKQKECTDSVLETPSARSQRMLQKSSAVSSQESQTSDQGLSRPIEPVNEGQESPVARRQPVRAAEVSEQLKELSKLLTAKEFQSKMDGVTLLLEHCKNNHKFVTSNITQIFDSFNPRLQDANKKVNQYALESAIVMIPLLKDSLHHVLVPLVTVVTDNLNSKNPGIYKAAVTVIDTLISNIDNLWLLQPFSSRIRFTSGRAMSDVTERLSVLVSSVYPRKPQAVERHVLPVLWYFLSNITGNGVLPGRNGNFKDVVSKLTKTLHKHMGSSLEEYASGQPQHAVTMLGDILGIKR
ncbi:TOG array regulator of axonemal microtubules protein 2 [Rhinophrynus dorsalis]